MNQYQVLKQYFGYDSFREGQEELIDSVLKGRDAFGIMPTGSGKSLCFQIPALMMPGITLVISPLISLMKDQVSSLNQAGVHAAYLNSSLTQTQYHKALSLARKGRYPIIYVAPERLETESFLDFARHVNISMVAVDEAHCVSQWGQDFRPSYLKILDFIDRLPNRPVICAFTATATRQVRLDVIRILRLQDPVVVATGYDRPNLYLGVCTPKDKFEALHEFVKQHQGESGIVYCLTRKLVEQVCERLKQQGFLVTRYHAGLSDGERLENQEDFIYDRTPIMVATNAFGMGIDKSNVRYVIHYNMPRSIEAFYQEIGRCSRDQEPGTCILFYSGQDVITNQLFIQQNQDNQELDPATRKLVTEGDRKRLETMNHYCFTDSCLCRYILQYFGEADQKQNCGNCQNCNSQFETVDVTDMAKALIECVKTSGQRYGINVILDTVRGADTAKIRQYGMKENPCYAQFGKVSVQTLRQVLQQLLATELLAVTHDGYSILKLTGQSDQIWMTETAVTMRVTEEDHKKQTTKGKKQARKKKPSNVTTGEDLSQQDQDLFEVLRQLRLEIAREEKVPPYIVFSDRTLISMCQIKPKTQAQMETVSGVGTFKCEKYGQRFLSCISEAVWGEEYKH